MLAGYWTGPIDGNWTPELTAPLKKFQTSLGVPATGQVDAPTLSALEQTIADTKAAATTTTTTTTTTTPATTTTEANDDDGSHVDVRLSEEAGPPTGDVIQATAGQIRRLGD